MTKTKNILLKLFVLLVLGVGWNCDAWAQRFEPRFAANEATATEWHYISFPLKSGSPKMYANTGNGQLNWSTNAPTDDYKWYLIGTKDNFIMKSVSGKYVYSTETGTNQGVQYRITESAGSATHFNLVNGNNANTWAIHRMSGNTGNNMNHRGGGGIMEWSVDDGCSVIFSNNNEIIKYSDAPSATDWAANTNWFTIRNNRSNQGTNNRKYITTSATGVDDNFSILPVLAALPNDRGSYWCFVGNASGFVIQNAAYGPDFVLAISGNQSNATAQMFRKGEVPSGYTYNFTAVENSVIDDGSFAYAFRLGNTGNTHIHVTQGHFIIYNHTAISGGDTGSAFKLTLTDKSVVNSLMDYDVYKVDVALGGTVAYRGSRAVFGKRGSLPSPYFILAKGNPEVTQADIQSGLDVETFSLTTPSGTYIKNINVTLSLPKIVHRRAYFYDKYESVAEINKPRNSSYVGRDGNGWMKNANTNDDIQKTSEYRIPVYLKPGTYRQMYMPTDKLAYYQRWYDYKTEGLVNTGVMPVLYSQNFKTYSNGHVSGKVASGIIGWQQNPTLYLPTNAGLPTDANGIYEDYIVGVDVSRFKDNSTDNATGNLTEPTLSQRVLFEIKDANKIAQELVTCTGAKWLESRNIIFPTIKRGTTARNTAKDALPIDMDLNNYWVYNTSHELVQLTSSNQIVVEVDDNTAGITASLMPSIGNNVGWGGVNFSQSHFISFEYPGTGTVRTVPDNSHATVKVYFKEGEMRYQLAKFELTFAPNTDPKIITEVIGKETNGDYKSMRSPYWLQENYGRPVAELTFDNKNILMKDNQPAGGVDGAGGTDIGTYLFPLDFAMTNYAYGYEKGDGTARGEYTIANARHIPGGQNANFRFKPVQYYYDVLNGTTNEHNNDQFYIYVDASDQPGEVMSLSIKDNLCAGTRLYVSGWMSTTSNNSNPASVILNLIAKNTGTGETKILTSYCPGMLHTYMYDEDGNEVAAMNNTTGATSPSIVINTQYWGLWSQMSFSFLLTSADVDNYNEFQLQVLNNCYNSSGGDYLLDNFQIFANPPKGNVDFTTPLCSDKVRHAKIHADYDMLKNLSSDGVNPLAIDEPEITASYCFVDSILFDSYVDPDLHVAIKDLFEKDERGNHSLKSGLTYNIDDINRAINRAFNVALVGRRCTKYKKDSEGNPYEDHGFHSYYIDNVFENIPVYAFNDSRDEVIYREQKDDGVRRIVFKEDVVRGEMTRLVDETDGNREYYPHMRPSRTYFLVFAPRYVSEASLQEDNVATEIFGIETSCAYFGTFTTKDPLHVILDNADIEADLPIQAVCHGETTAFYFNIPVLKADKPVVDEEYCISDADLNNKVVPESQGVHHYRYEVSFKDDAISGVIKNLPYDWWMGGKLEERTYRGTIEEYQEATHPSIVYNHDTADPSHTHTHDADYKKHGEPVNIALAMEDFRFFYPDFGKNKFDPATGKNNISDAEWATLTPHDYNNDSGYSLLQSEINTIKSFVNAGIIVLHRNTYDMPLTYEEAEELQDKEMSDMMEKEMNDQILELALTLNTDPSVAALLPLKGLEGTVLDKLSIDGKKRLTFEEFGNFTRDQLVGIASDLKDKKGLLTGVTSEQINTMSDGELRRVVEAELRDMPDDEMLEFAKDYFPNIGHEKRAYLVVRALNILSRETVAALSPADQQNSVETRKALRNQMISIFSDQQELVLRKMWSDVSAKLTEEERTELLKDALHPETPKDPATMNAAGLAVLVEDGLAQLTNNVINDLRGDRYVHFTLVPIMPSQVNFVDEPYIFCPEPRGVKLRITSHEPKMIDGFADMDYPQDMENVPVRIGLPQIKETRASAEKTLRIPVRGLKPATKNGVKAVKLAENTGYGKNIFLAETDDPKYQQTKTQGMAEAKKDMGAYTQLVGTVESMIANYPTAENRTPDNFIVVKFNEGMKFREGYTYRVGINYMENDINDDPTISCFGTMLFDMKIVPEYQKWTAAVGNSDWTNDENWARADRDELNAGKQAAGDKIDALATALDDAVSYISNEDNETSTSFVPMYFTNVLLDNNATMAAVLYTEKESQEAKAFKPASRSEKTFLEGLHSTATENIKYEMEVAPSTGAWHDDENYECGLFGTYVANGITFKPAAQLGNAHFLAYNKAWVEYELDADRWYTLGSPLKASVAGDWYSPTEGGKQMTPHFYDINYDPAKNDRFRPAYYQRSWDRGGNNVVYEKSGDTYDSYVKADWSFVYNDAAVDYSAGGFSVKPDIEFMEEGDRPDDGKVLVRLPKADKAYKYYDINGNIGNADDAVIVDDEQAARADRDSNRLLSDDLRADGSGSITMSVSNQTADNNYLLLSNPFMAAMDMDEFFNANEDLEVKYWIMVAGEQNVSVKTDDGWITTGDAGGKYVAPLQGFFVKTKDGAANKNSIRASYTAAMQTVITSSPTNDNGAPVLQARTRGGNAEASNIIRLTAERNGATSTAMIVLSGNAKDEYVATEDCETFIDGNIYDKPTVYTSSGSVAQTINVRKSLDMVPVGMVSSDDSETTLRFDLSAVQIGGSKLYLYDGETDSYTEIEDGAEVAMSGNTAGRYFLTTSIDDVNDVLRNDTVKKGVWTISGVFCGESIEGLMPGVYVVDGVKMYVR